MNSDMFRPYLQHLYSTAAIKSNIKYNSTKTPYHAYILGIVALTMEGHVYWIC